MYRVYKVETTAAVQYKSFCRIYFYGRRDYGLR